ncbi:MAG: TolC family protein [Myxococcota bacterium]
MELRRVIDEERNAVEDAMLRLRASVQRVSAATAQEAAAARALAATLKGYEAGRSTQLDIVLAERDQLDAEGARIQALAEFAYLKRVLELRSGRSWEGRPR